MSFIQPAVQGTTPARASGEPPVMSTVPLELSTSLSPTPSPSSPQQQQEAVMEEGAVHPSSESSRSSCATCNDRIHGWPDVKAALCLAWRKQKRHLITAWIHVPIGVTFLLVCVWGLKLALDDAPFRFPASVLTMATFFGFLLLLDWLSLIFPGRKNTDVENANEKAAAPKEPEPPRKRFVEPVMALLAPPCEFCLRNMSVMFTPSFILIPARETLPGRDIGLLAGWFAATQLLAFLFPVLASWFVNWLFRKTPRKTSSLLTNSRRRAAALGTENSAVQSGALTGSTATSRKNSTATLTGMDFEKRISYAGGHKLGSIATGLSGLTAVVVAPVSHVNMSDDDNIVNKLDSDARSQLESVAMEHARQQGDPFMRRSRSQAPSAAPAGSALPRRKGPPRSDVSTYEHLFLLRSHSHVGSSTGEHRSRSRSRSRDRRRPGSRPGSKEGSGLASPRADSIPSSPPVSPAAADAPSSPSSPASPALSEWRFPPPGKLERSLTIGSPNESVAAGPFAPQVQGGPPRRSATVDEDAEAGRLGSGRSITFDFASSHGARRGTVPKPLNDQPTLTTRLATALVPSRLRQTAFTAQDISTDSSPAASRAPSNAGLVVPTTSVQGSQRPSLTNSTATLHETIVKEKGKEPEVIVTLATSDRVSDEVAAAGPEQDEESITSEECPDAIERLADWLADLITPAVYLIAFVIGIPLYYTLDFALLLFLAVNLLTFIAAITVIPPQIRRFLHPILSCSIATVLIIWALGAIKGLGIKEALAQYSRPNARYTDLWNPSGYRGPIPGAGDVLFSTLDAGIVALAVPMYRYRKDLRVNFGRMMAVLVPCAALSLFLWPTIGRFVGLDPARSLAFSARFMSTPLAIEMANNVGADESITIILVVLTGIIAAILKEPFFKVMRVPDSDFVTWGITMGSTSGAIGASSLISKPRTMAIASLSFVLFGAILLICAAIPPIVNVMHQLAGDPFASAV